MVKKNTRKHGKKASGTSFSMSLSLHSLKRVWFPSMLTEENKKLKFMG